MHEWTPSDVVTIIAALSAFAVSVINALKNTQTKTRGEDNQDRLNSLARHIQAHDQQLTTLALSIPAAGVSIPAAGAGVLASAAPTASGLAPQNDLIAPQGTDAEAPQ